MLQVRDLCVSDVMTPAPRCLDERCTLGGAAAFLTEDHLRGAPVVDAGGRLRGVVSQSDLIRAILPVLGEGEPDLAALRRVRETPVKALLGDGATVSCSPSTRLTDACKHMVRHRVHRLLVTRDGELVGLIAAIDVARAIAALYERVAAATDPFARELPERQPLVSTWMTAAVVAARPDDTARQALELMEEHDIRHLLVLDGDDVAGILSNRDVVRVTARNAGRVLDLEGTTAADIMTPAPLRTIAYQATIAEAAEAMQTHKVSALPVLREGRLAGIITSDDLLAATWIESPAVGATR